jgi:arylsulfatase A-like enzyme
VGIVVGIFDTTVVIKRNLPEIYSSLIHTLMPIVTVSLIGFFSFALLWPVVSRIAGKVIQNKTQILLLNGMIVLIFWLLILPNNERLLRLHSFSFYVLLQWILVLVIFSSIVFILLRLNLFSLLIQRMGDQPFKWGLTLFCLTFEVFLYFWLKMYHLTQNENPFWDMLYFLLLLLLAGLTVYLIFRIPYDKPFEFISVFLFVLFYIIVSLLFLNSLPSTQKKPLPSTPTESKVIERIIFITIDALRTDYLSCYSDSPVLTPHIDQIAEDAVLFKNAFTTAPWTLPSFATIMTGMPTLVHGATLSNTYLPDTLKTIAEWLYESGYETVGIGDNPFLNEHFRMHQGFSYYNFFPNPAYDSGYSLGAKIIYHKLFRDFFQSEATTTDLTDLSIQAIDKVKDKPLFFWLHYFDPHLPYAPPVQYLPKTIPTPSIGSGFSDLRGIRSGDLQLDQEEREWIQYLYGQEIRYVDDEFGRLIQWLKKEDLYEDALIIISSDHGEEFWDHGGFEHGHTLYNELLRVPLLIKLPSSFRAPVHTIIEENVSMQQILPTILELCQIEILDKEKYNYEPSLSTHWEIPGKVDKSGPPIISTGLLYYDHKISVLMNNFKYIRDLTNQFEELFNLTDDPYEKINIALQGHSYKETLNEILGIERNKALDIRNLIGLMDENQFDLDKATLERLRSLGYIQ